MGDSLSDRRYPQLVARKKSPCSSGVDRNCELDRREGAHRFAARCDRKRAGVRSGDTEPGLRRTIAPTLQPAWLLESVNQKKEVQSWISQRIGTDAEVVEKNSALRTSCMNMKRAAKARKRAEP